ncbi:MAG: metallo-mystery pair system four-Cys motif protein [Deltaproteobacteria bacterium]|nr:metallo-mystery pair system four-Cys motif protein [Deltaproteobacteria bacterium]
MLCFLFPACSRDVAVEVSFVATIHGAPFSCTAAASGFTPFDLRFYVHGIELIDRSGAGSPLTLTDDGVWQSDGVALLDFENGTGSCGDGTMGTHTVLSGHVRAGDYIALRFILGVPFDRNHADPATADAPFNLGRMHWGWQGGYKFLRFEGEGPQGAARVHLGSTGCEGTIGNIARCQRPNRAPVRLDGFQPGHNRVQLDLAALLPPNGDTASGKRPISCMSEVDDEGCRSAFAALGLDLQSGEPHGPQKLFSSQPL